MVNRTACLMHIHVSHRYSASRMELRKASSVMNYLCEFVCRCCRPCAYVAGGQICYILGPLKWIGLAGGTTQ